MAGTDEAALLGAYKRLEVAWNKKWPHVLCGCFDDDEKWGKVVGKPDDFNETMMENGWMMENDGKWMENDGKWMGNGWMTFESMGFCGTFSDPLPWGEWCFVFLPRCREGTCAMPNSDHPPWMGCGGPCHGLMDL